MTYRCSRTWNGKIRIEYRQTTETGAARRTGGPSLYTDEFPARTQLFGRTVVSSDWCTGHAVGLNPLTAGLTTAAAVSTVPCNQANIVRNVSAFNERIYNDRDAMRSELQSRQQ